jgi:biopolymer transport protein ExbB/TolQ
MEAIVTAFREGGGWMYAILVVNILVIGIAVERTIWLYFQARVDRRPLMKQIENHLRAGEIDRAKKLVARSRAPLSRVMAAGLGTHGQGYDAAMMLMNEAQLMELPRIEVRVGYLVMFSNVATLLGLLGTIVGLIRSFGAVASASASEKATELARGISEAMNCTAFGLIVAISALLIYAALQNRAHRMSDDVKHAVQSLGIVISETKW